MSEKRYPPSARKLDEARGQGDVAVSPQLVRAAAALVALATLVGTGAVAGGRLVALARHAFAGGAELAVVGAEAWSALRWCVVPVLLAALAAALASGLLQTRGLVTSPRGSSHGRDEGVLRGVGLGVVVAAGAALALVAERTTVTGALADGSDGAALLGTGFSSLGRVSLRIAAVAVLVGIADLALRQLAWRRRLWMTRDEVDRERREEQGDPRLRGEQRRRHQALSSRGLADKVAGSALMILGDGVAVGLRITGGRVTIACSGERLVAARLVDLARRLRVPVRSDVELAALLAPLLPGEEVPATARLRELVRA